jgi:hypothetical protein
MATESLDEVHLDALPEGPLADLRNQRTGHRHLPGYGPLADRSRVYLYLRDASPEYGGVVYLTEVRPDGRRLRQVEQLPDGDALRTDYGPMNRPLTYATGSTPQWRSAPMPARMPGVALGQTLTPDADQPRPTVHEERSRSPRCPGAGHEQPDRVGARLPGRRWQTRHRCGPAVDQDRGFGSWNRWGRSVGGLA